MRSFRHLDYPERFPVGRLGPAGIDALLDRGDFEAWAELATAVRADPHGALADTVLRICAAHPMYGTSALWTTWIEELRARPETLSLRELRKRLGMTQSQVAGLIGSSQSDVSKLERRDDIRVSTLREYVSALGADTEIAAVLEAKRWRVRIGSLELPARSISQHPP